MSTLKSDDNLNKLDRKFGWLLALTLIIDGIVTLILQFFYFDLTLIALTIMFFIFGVMMSFILIIKPKKTDFWPHSLVPSIIIVIILSVIAVVFWFLPVYRSIDLFLLSLDGLLILWTILLQRQTRKAASNKPVE
jgi:hypothetical protein